MQTQDPKGAPAVLGGLVTPNPSGIAMGHPECPSWGPAPGASPELGRVMGAPSHPSAAGVPCARCFTKEGTNQRPQEPWLCPPAPWGALQGDPWLQHRFRGTQKQLGWCSKQGFCPFWGIQHTTAPGRASLGSHMLLQHNSYPWESREELQKVKTFPNTQC